MVGGGGGGGGGACCSNLLEALSFLTTLVSNLKPWLICSN